MFVLNATFRLVPFVFIFAALNKLIHINEFPIPDHLLFESPLVTHALIQFKLLLGLCLIAKIKRRLVVNVTALIFVSFIGVHLLSLYLKRETCGCFGSWEISPGFGLIMNLIFFISIIVQRRNLPKEPNSRMFLCCLSVGLSILSTLIWISYFSFH